MNEFEILICYIRGSAAYPFHSMPGYHEIGRRAGFIVQVQISRSDLHVNVSRRAGAPLDTAVKFPIRAGAEPVTEHKAAHERALEGEKWNDE
jgi:hypothetical protein